MLKRFLTALLVLIFPAFAFAEDGYLSGGSEPLPQELQATLDRHQDLLTLGINHDWMRSNDVDPATYVQAVDVVAKAVKAERIPGAQIYVDRMQPKMMPTGIGFRITDPQEYPVEHDTLYYVHDLTGPLITVPLVLAAIQQEVITYDQELREFLPVLEETDKATITVGMLLQHTSGLPREYVPDFSIESREDVSKAVRTMPLVHEPGTKVHKSPMNFFVLGLLVERLYDAQFSEVAEANVFQPANLAIATLGAPDTKRMFIAAGEYSDRLGRMAWGEDTTPIGHFLEPDAGHTGLVTSSDTTAALAMRLLMAASSNVAPDGTPFTEFGKAFIPNPSVEGGEHMGMGYEVGKYGPRSFGWDSPMGSSFWVLPEKTGYVIYLSNPAHPDGIGPDFQDPREEVLPLLSEALKPLPSTQIDTNEEGGESSPGSATPPEE